MKRSRKNLNFFLFVLVVFFSILSVSGCSSFENPEVTSISPGNNTIVSELKPLITVNFTRDMNKESVEEAFAFQSLSSTPEGKFIWQSSSSVSFELRDDLVYGQRYSIEIRTSAKDREGNSLKGSYISYFYVGEANQLPEVTSTVPVHLSMDVVAGTPITVNFSVAMDHQSVEDAFSISPSVSGHFEWASDSQSFSYVPDDLLVNGQYYAMTIDTGAKDIFERFLKYEQVSFFRIGTDFIPPAIDFFQSTSVPDLTIHSDEVNKDDVFLFTFSEAVNVGTFENAMSITNDSTGQSVSGTYMWNSGNDSVSFYPESDLSIGDSYTVEIKDTFSDAYDNRIKDPLYYTFSVNGITSAYLQVVSLNIVTNSSSACSSSAEIGGFATTSFNLSSQDTVHEVEFDDVKGWSCGIAVQFSASVDQGTFPDSVNLTRLHGTDSLAGGIVCVSSYCYTWVTPDNVQLFLNDIGDAVYSFKISGKDFGVKDVDGNPMKDDFVLYFHAQGL